MATNNLNRIKRLVAAVQKDIVSCPNEQYTEAGEVAFWIFGSPTHLSDVLMNHNVPEEIQDAVVSVLRCPACGSSLEVWQQVGTKYSFEQDHEAGLEIAHKKYGDKLLEFQDFLCSFPLLGATHPIGKCILREIQRSTKAQVQVSRWFRAARVKAHASSLPPRIQVPDQRYNSSGQARWYLADSADAAVAEVAEADGRAWVQELEIDMLGEFLDLRSWAAEDDRVLDEQGEYLSPHGLLVVALIFGDLLTKRPCDAEDKKWEPEYLIPRFVAEAAERTGFSGILCNSVRSPGKNLIIFEANWLPKNIGEPFEILLNEEEKRRREGFYWNRGRRDYF